MTAQRTRIAKPTKYRDYILAPKGDGLDMIDPTIGRWTHFPSQRYAKWSATFMSNILARMGANPPKRNLPEVQEV